MGRHNHKHDDLGDCLRGIFGIASQPELKKKTKAFSDKEWERRKKARKRAKAQRKLQRQRNK